MSPSRRRAIGAVRRLASRAPRHAPLAALPSTRLSPRPVAVTHTHYPGGAMGTSRPTAITPGHYATLFRTHIDAPCRAPLPRPVAVGRDARSPGLPARAAAPSARCAAWQVARAESFAGASPCAPHSRAGRGVRSPHPRRPAAAPPGSRHRIFTLKISMKTAPTDDGIRMADFR